MDYMEIVVFTTSDAEDAVSEVLMEAGADGVSIENADDIIINQNDKKDWDYLNSKIFSELNGEVRVICYLRKDDTLRSRMDQIKTRMEDLLELSTPEWQVGSGRIAHRIVRTQDWANEWKKYYKATKVGKSIAIVPTWEHYHPIGNEHIVNLDPGMAFGTGTHETTVMCIELLESTIRSGNTMLDIGCGTGILAICGLKLGASKVIAIDRDTVAVRVCKENAKLNGVIDSMEIVHGDLLDKDYEKADVVIVNIVADAIIEILQYADRVLKSDARLICSGIIRERESDVIKAMHEKDYELIERKERGEWVALLLKQRS